MSRKACLHLMMGTSHAQYTSLSRQLVLGEWEYTFCLLYEWEPNCPMFAHLPVPPWWAHSRTPGHMDGLSASAQPSYRGQSKTMGLLPNHSPSYPIKYTKVSWHLRTRMANCISGTMIWLCSANHSRLVYNMNMTIIIIMYNMYIVNLYSFKLKRHPNLNATCDNFFRHLQKEK